MTIDPQLLKDCIRSDRKAQYKLYQTCFQVLMGVCMRYRKNEADAASALNMGFFKILDRLDTYNPEVPFQAWIKRIMINTLIDEFRKERKVRELIHYTDMKEHEYTTDLVDYNEADKQFDAAQLEALIQLLPPVSQKVFNLFAIDGYAHKEIATLLGIKEGTSKWHLSFARKKLRELLYKRTNSSKVI
ncbi:MAG: sigma-70 family RNA polymerase sigma factor [Bacteroidota bacterium]